MLEQTIAKALQKKYTYSGNVSSEDLGGLLTKVLGTIVAEQKFAGIDVPIEYHISEMNVSVQSGKAKVTCTMLVHNPINATLKFRYTLENHPFKEKLCLTDNHVEISEITRSFDFAAKVALKVMDVRQIVLDQLRNPNAVIRRVLPVHLSKQGFEGRIACVGMQIQPDDTIAVTINADKYAVH
jgi:hypothetical protein